jgi:hypothetical protein
METSDCNGFCICIKCNTRIEHSCGKPCRVVKCPGCGKPMLREGSYHHQLYLQKINFKPDHNNHQH